MVVRRNSRNNNVFFCFSSNKVFWIGQYFKITIHCLQKVNINHWVYSECNKNIQLKGGETSHKTSVEYVLRKWFCFNTIRKIFNLLSTFFPNKYNNEYNNKYVSNATTSQFGKNFSEWSFIMPYYLYRFALRWIISKFTTITITQKKNEKNCTEKLLLGINRHRLKEFKVNVISVQNRTNWSLDSNDMSHGVFRNFSIC